MQGHLQVGWLDVSTFSWRGQSVNLSLAPNDRKRQYGVRHLGSRQQKTSNNLSQINYPTSNACKKHTSFWQTEYLKYQTSKTLLHIFSHLLRNAGCLNPHDQTRLRQGTQNLGEASAEGPPFRLHWDHRYRHTPWHYDSSTSWGVWIASWGESDKKRKCHLFGNGLGIISNCWAPRLGVKHNVTMASDTTDLGECTVMVGTGSHHISFWILCQPCGLAKRKQLPWLDSASQAFSDACQWLLTVA